MPLLNPTQIHSVLKESGVVHSRNEDGPKGQLPSLLANASLSAEEVLEHVSSMMRSGENDGVRLRAAEMGLKLNKLLGDDSQRPDFQVTINIIDSEFASLNPILIPRENSI